MRACFREQYGLCEDLELNLTGCGLGGCRTADDWITGCTNRTTKLLGHGRQRIKIINKRGRGKTRCADSFCRENE
jgi:hypothetical protein